jgi:hypothetical protein
MQFVAISPDNPDVVVVAGIGPVTAVWQAAASKDGGLNFSDMGAIIGASAGATAILNAYDLDVSPISSGNIYYVAIAGTRVGGIPAVFYYNFGATVGSWRDAVLDFGTASVVPAGTNPAAMWAAKVIPVVPTNFRAVQFSSNFGSDFSVLAISEDSAAGADYIWLHIFSLASHKWDTDLNLLNYPVAVDTEDGLGAGVFAVRSASIATGPDFMGIEEETIIVFVGASALDDGAETGGIYRVDETGFVTVIRNAGINSLAFDGTTLVAGSYDTNNVWRVLDVTANQPTAASARTMKKIGIDDTLANDMVIVKFAGANVFGAKSGDASALSKSTDYGNTWNDFTLMDSANTFINDIYMLPDGSAWYMSADDWDGVEGESSVYRMSGMTAQRVLCVDMLTVAGSPHLMLRGIPGDPNVIYAGAKDITDIYVSADGGVTRWSRKTTFPGTAINDMAVESATVVYVANGVMVYKSTNSGSLWSEGVDTQLGGGVFNLRSLGDGKLLAGGNAGGVAFSVDSGATWTPTLGVMGGGPVYVAATGLGPTDTIFAASSVSLNVYKGPAAFFAEFKSMNVPAIPTPVGGTADPGSMNTGIELIDGVLYVLETFEDGDLNDKLGPAIQDPTGWDATYLIHSMAPTVSPHAEAMWGTRYPADYDQAYTLSPYSMTTVPGSALEYVKTATSVKLYGIDAGGSLGLNLVVTPPPDTYEVVLPMPGIYYYEDIVSMPSAAPVLRTPADDELFEIVSSMLADAELVSFTWNRAAPQITSYELWIALDEGFNEMVPLWNAGAAAFQAPVVVASPQAIVSIIAGRGAFDPGKTYYWMVNVVTPFNGVSSEVRSFTIAPSAASVPEIASPANGASNVGTKPSFSWTPTSGATKYEFQLDTGTSFTAPMVSEQVATSAIMPNVTLDEGKSYFWRVRALEPVPSEWSAIGTFTVAVPEPPPVTPTQTVVPPPTITITQPPDITFTIPTATTGGQVPSAAIWAIIIIGAVLVIAVIVLIVRTRRQV